MFELTKMVLYPFSYFVTPIIMLSLLFLHKTFYSTKAIDSHARPYPLIGHLFGFYHHNKGNTLFQWFCTLILSSPSSSFVIHRPFGERIVMTANPATVEHILRANFSNYQKGPILRDTVKDFVGNGILNVDGETWKIQRQVAIHEFNTKTLRRYIEVAVDAEIVDRLVPILSDAAKKGTVLNLQDILQSFTFDNICKIAFGYDPKLLASSLPIDKFGVAIEDATTISTQRFRVLFPVVWKILRFLNTGSEKRLKEAVLEVQELASSIIRHKKNDMMIISSLENEDLLSRLLKSGKFDDKTVLDIVISFILAGRDTTSAALTWFFWLLDKNNSVEEEIVKEVKNRGKNRGETENRTCSTPFDEVKEMVYTHAALCESMRLYPPVPADTKEVMSDDVLPDGIPVKKGMRVSYFPYAMGRSERIWGDDWAEYRPERWLKEVEIGAGKKMRRFVPRDAFSYPVFQAGPRTCIGKEMAFLQMKRVVATVLDKFKVIPLVEEGAGPVYVPNLSAKMQGGLPVRIEKRIE